MDPAAKCLTDPRPASVREWSEQRLELTPPFDSNALDRILWIGNRPHCRVFGAFRTPMRIDNSSLNPRTLLRERHLPC